MPVRTWDDVKAFTKAVADFLARGLPDRFTSLMTRTKRTGKIFIDYMRNMRGATAIEVYSTRARKGAPIAVPLRWEELSETRSDSFTLANIRERLQKAGNPWEGYMDLKQPITDEMRLRLGIGPDR
jgi:bifunctional non-homologous end joining protein LigD